MSLIRNLSILCLITITAASNDESAQEASARIVGGALTTIDQYPYAVTLSRQMWGDSFIHNCGGTILTTTAILSAAHCFSAGGVIENVNIWRARVGSSFASSGGTVHTPRLFVIHPQYIPHLTSSDVAVVRTTNPITYVTNAVAPGSIAGTNYLLQDDQPVIAIGWGLIGIGQSLSEQLKHVPLRSVSQDICRERYAAIGSDINEGMMCSGVLDVAGVGSCTADSGGPVLHNGVVVGVTSFGAGCAGGHFPDVNVRVSLFSNWIVTSATA